MKLKKAGKSVISYTCSDYETGEVLNVKSKINVYAYKNPLKTFKIGKKNFSGKFKSSPFYSPSSKYAGKLTVKAASGWKIVGIRQAKNGSTVLSLGDGTMTALKNKTNVDTKCY